MITVVENIPPIYTHLFIHFMVVVVVMAIIIRNFETSFRISLRDDIFFQSTRTFPCLKNDCNDNIIELLILLILLNFDSKKMGCIKSLTLGWAKAKANHSLKFNDLLKRNSRHEKPTLSKPIFHW